MSSGQEGPLGGSQCGVMERWRKYGGKVVVISKALFRMLLLMQTWYEGYM